MILRLLPAILLACATEPDEGPFTRASAALANGDEAGATAEIGAVEDPVAKDILRIRLAAEYPARGAALCAGVTTDYAKTKCSQVLGRPHLQSTHP